MNPPDDRFLLGRIDGKLDAVLLNQQKIDEVLKDHNLRITTLEQSHLKSETQRRTLMWVISTIGAGLVSAVGAAISYLKV